MSEDNQLNIEGLESDITTERSRLSSDRMDISIGELMNLYKADELIIRPEYQRFYRWKSDQKTALIESILLGIPIPPIFVAEDTNGIWELVDGLQRISTILSFFGDLKPQNSIEANYEDEIEEERISLENKWILEAGSLLPTLEGLNIDTLPTKYKINIKRAICRVEILRGESNIEMKYELFKRLNSGGSKATPQEVRNAIYRGTDTRLNELITRLASNPVFQNLTMLSKQKISEQYDQELILRFIALYNNIESVNDNTETFLNDFMSKTVAATDFDYELYEALFIEIMNMLEGFGPQIFRNTRNLFVPSVFEGITVALAQNIEIFRQHPLTIEKIDELKADADFIKFSGRYSNSKSRIKNRLTRANEIFQTY